MLLFNRIASFKSGNPLDNLAFATEAAAIATNAMGIPVAVYAARFGAPLNQIMWSARVESLAQLEEANGKLLADAAYAALLPRGAELLDGAPTDNVSQVVSATLTPEPKRVYGVTQAVIAAGKTRQAMDFGVRILDYACSETGLPGAFVSSLYSDFGAVGWLIGGDTMADMDKFHALQLNDHKFHDLVDEGQDLFIDGSGRNQLIEKVN